MALQTVRRVAADLLNAGESRIRILDVKAAGEALTREDVRKLIRDKAVIVIPKDGVSRGKARITQSRKHAGRGRGKGSKKGSIYAQTTRKDLWIRKVRSQRKTLRNQKFRLASADYRRVYRMVGGNAFKGKKQLLEFISKSESKE